MALITQSLQYLAGANLPNVVIENVSMSVGLDPEPESNPHINSEREYTYSGISQNKLIQKPSFSTKQIQNKNLFVDVTMSILNIETLSQSLILNQVNYLNFVYVKVIQSFSENLTNELLSSNFSIDIKNIKNINDYTENIFKLSDFYENKTLSFVNNNTNVYKHIKQTRFTSKNPQKQHLDIFAFAYLDVDELINSFELNIPNGFEVKGNISKERVIYNNKVESQSYILVDQNNNTFIGTPIKGRTGKFYATKPVTPAQELTQQPLKVVPVTNKKVSDLRNLDTLILDNLSNTNSLQISNTANTNNISVDIIKKPYISELYKSRQKTNQYSCFFIFDIYTYLKDNSKTPEIYDNPNTFDFIKIKKLNIIRKRVKTINSVIYPFSEYTPDKTIISTSETSFGNLINKISFMDSYNKQYTTSIDEINNGNFGSTLPSFATIENLKKIASVTELKIPTAANYRTFSFTDYEIATLTSGEYQYSIDIEIEDKSNELIQSEINYLTDLRNVLTSYLIEAQRFDMFSIAENKQNDKFINSQIKKYNPLNLNNIATSRTINNFNNTGNAPWVVVPTAICVFTNKYINKIDIAEKVKFYYKLLNPSTTNPTNIQNVLNDLQSLIEQISKKFDINEKTDKNSQSYKAQTIKTKSLSNTFKAVIDSDIKKAGIDYLALDENKIDNLTTIQFGLPKIKKSTFDNRITTEIKKYFTNTSNINLSSLNNIFSSDEINSLSDINSFSSCYFSPATIFDNNNESYSLNTFDSTTMDFEKYDTIVQNTFTATSKKFQNDLVNNGLSSRTSFKLSTINDFSSNLTTNNNIDFITKSSLMINSIDVFNNVGFNTANNLFDLKDSCSDVKTENESLSSLSSLVNLLYDGVIRPESINDIFDSTTSINTIEKFDVLSQNNIISNIKNNTSILDNSNVKSSQVFPNSVAIKQNIGFQQVKQSTTAFNTATPATLNGAMQSQNSNTTQQQIVGNISQNAHFQQINQSKNAFNSLTNIPLQIKSLMLGSVVDTKFKLNTYSFDPFLHPQTKNFMRLNFQDICQIEYLAGFENGQINNPIWRLLTKEEYDQLSGLVIIRAKKYVNKLFNIGTEIGIELDTYNEFAIIEKDEIPQASIQQTQIQNLLPNINININNTLINTENLLNNLKLSAFNQEQEQLIKQLVVINTIDANIKSSYTFSKLELDNVNK